MKHGARASQIRDWRLAVIFPAVGKKGTERATIVRDIAGREHVTPTGDRKRVPERTLYRWLDLHEREGAAGLQRQQRADASATKAIVSVKWDRAVLLDDATKHRIGDRLRQYIRGLRAKGMDMNRNAIWHNPHKVPQDGIDRMNRFWGDKSWRQAAYVENIQTHMFNLPYKVKQSNDTIVKAFQKRLKDIAGFDYVPDPLPMQNSSNAIVYCLFFASAKPVAQKIIKNIFDR